MTSHVGEDGCGSLANELARRNGELTRELAAAKERLDAVHALLADLASSLIRADKRIAELEQLVNTIRHLVRDRAGWLGEYDAYEWMRREIRNHEESTVSAHNEKPPCPPNELVSLNGRTKVKK